MRGTKLALTGLSAAALLACGVASAKDIQCDVDSDYDMTVNERSVIFTKPTGTPRAVVMRQGRLFVDEAWVTLSDEDGKRVAEYEKQTRATLPVAQQIGKEAADIAFTALGEVAAGLSSRPDRTRAELDKARKEIDVRLNHAVAANRFNGNELGNGITRAIAEVLPIVIGDIVGGAVTAAFSGDQARLARMENLDKDIERKVEPRAKRLEARAEDLCRRMEALDAIDDALAYRLPDGGRLNLMDAKIEVRDDKR